MPQDTTKYKAFLQDVRDLIARNRMDEALGRLRSALENSPLLDEVILQSGRHADIRQQIRLGTVGREEADRTQNQIRSGLLDLLQEIENTLEGDGSAAEHPDREAVKTEFERAVSIVNSKNTVVDSSINAGRDVHIGDKHVTQYAEGNIYNIGHIDKADFS